MRKEKQLAADLFSSFNRFELGLLEESLSDNVKHSAQGTAFGAELEGKAGYVDHMRGVFSNFKSIEFKPDRIHFDEGENAVVVEWTGDFVTAKGVPYSSGGVFVMTLAEDGKIAWVREYFDTEKTKQAMS